jgi:alpha-mannosidase
MQKYLPFILVVLLGVAASAGVQNTFDLRQNGTIPVWLVAGPFPNGKPLYHGTGCFGYFKDYLTARGGETHCQPQEGDAVEFGGQAAVLWQTAFSDGAGVLDFIELFHADKAMPGAAYAFCSLVVAKEQNLQFRIRSNDGVRAWLNEQMILDHHLGRGLDSGEDTVRVDLQKGLNRVLLKIDQSGGAWGCALALNATAGMKQIKSAISAQQLLAGRIASSVFTSTSLIARTPGGERQVIVADITSGGAKEVTCLLAKQEWSKPVQVKLGDLAVGKHRKEILVPPISQTGPVHVQLQMRHETLDLGDIEFRAPIKWTVYLNQHTHTDIGYTKPQHEILSEHLRYIDYALDYCDLTDQLPDPARFRWTCEVSWAAREYLKRRPAQQIERLKTRVRQGRIEVGGLFLHLSDIADENVIAASLQPIKECKEQGIPVVTGLQNDVPGIAWCLVDFLADTDVKYLSVAINNDRTPRPFDVPTLFWWESSSGQRMLTLRPDHYHTGNHLRIEKGAIEPFKIRLIEYLEQVKAKGYPFDRIALQYSGKQIDNSPPDWAVCEFINNWNSSYAWPKLRSATMCEFFDYAADHYGPVLPAYRGAWPNWWTDGFAFPTRETAVARKAHADVQAVETLFCLAGLQGHSVPISAIAEVNTIKDDLLFYDEHTFGAQEEFSDPLAVNSVEQYNEKAAYIWGALSKIDLLRHEAVSLMACSSQPPALPVRPMISVINTLAWPRSGLVRVFIDYSVVPPDKPFRVIDESNDQSAPVRQTESRVEGSYWDIWVEQVPALSSKQLRIEFGGQQIAPSAIPAGAACVLENEYYRLQIDPKTGAISTLLDKETRTELVDQKAAWQMGQYIYDLLSDSQFDSRASYLQRSKKSTVTEVQVDAETDNPIWQSIRISATADGCLRSGNNPGVRLEVRLYKHTKMIELYFEVVKKFAPVPEALYIAFPFALDDGKFLFDTLGGLVAPGENQIPGSSADWHSFHTMACLRDKKMQIVMTSDAMPLLQFGDINIGKWQQVARVEKPHVYSWVVNNYWTAPFPGAKEGVLRWSYFITSSADTSRALAMRFGMNWRTPFAARVSPTYELVPLSPASWPASLPANVLVANMRPSMDGKGAIVQLRELDGKETMLNGNEKLHIVNVLEEVLQPEVKSIVLKPFAVKFVRMDF